MAGTIGRDPYYEIQIIINGRVNEPMIHAYLPEQVAMSSESTWEPILGSGILGSTIDGISSLAGAGKVTGYQVNPLFQSICGWQGNSPLTWSFDLQFNAIDDPVTDVLTPIITLLELTMPVDLGQGLVQAPGPNAINILNKALQNTKPIVGVTSLVNEFTKRANSMQETLGNRSGSEESCTVKIGNFMVLRDVVITSVSPRFDTQFHKGLPISAEATVDFKMMYAGTRDILNSIFTTRSNR